MRLICLSVFVWLAAAIVDLPLAYAETNQPNIIYVLADDLGYGDLGCYGQKQLKTPHLDKMAAEGMRFTRHYAGSTVCAPSRCVLMTGLHTGHCRVRGNGPGVLRADDLTFATRLQRAGYRTGAFGKWGIGNPPPLDDPNRHGFDQFYGYINMFHAHNYYPEFLIRNGRKEPLRNRLFASYLGKRQSGPTEGSGVAQLAIDYAPQLIADEALDFIRSAKDHKDQPFFLYYALNIPHANNEGGNEKRIARNGMRVPDLGPHANTDWPIQEQGFARMIDYIDRDIGNILSLLQELKLDDNTLVIFSSDNGPHQEGGHKVDYFDSNGSLRGKKRDLYDGGVRVPMIARWPGTVSANSTTDHLSGFQDVFATLLQVGGVKDIPQTDGISFLPTLSGRFAEQRKHAHLYWEFSEQGGKDGVVTADWKFVRLNTSKTPPGRVELFNLQIDPEEQTNVADQHPEVVASLTAIAKAEHSTPETN